MQFGDVNLEIVSDGTYSEDGGRLFGLVPKVLWEQVARPDARNCLRLGMRCLLIQTAQHQVLVGTGFGDKLSKEQRGALKLDGERRLLSALERLGVAPQDVDLVVNTHLHAHHSGGNTMCGTDGALVPTFSQAKYCIQRLELADAYFPNERTRASYFRENLHPVERDGQLRILDGDTRLTDHVRVILAAGHTRAHQCVVIESGDRRALFLGDVAHWPTHIEHLSWVTAYDVEPLSTIQTRRSLARWAIEHQALLIFEHHPEIEAGYLHATQRPDRFRLEPAAISR